MRIIFENQDKSIGIIIPTKECVNKFGIEAIAKKDVPVPYEYPSVTKIDEKGNEIVLEYAIYYTPYWIVDDNFIPSDREYRGAWEIDGSMGEPHGYGHQESTFEGVEK